MRELVAFMVSAAIGLVALAAVYPLYEDARVSQSASETIRQVEEMAGRLAARYSTKAAGYGTADAAIGEEVIVGFNMEPAGIGITGTGSTTKLLNEWNGEVTVMGKQTFVEITWPAVPDDVCRVMLARMPGGGTVTKVKVGSATVRDLPVSDANILTDCGTAAATIVFTGGEL